jgi:hypothetical protein
METLWWILFAVSLGTGVATTWSGWRAKESARKILDDSVQAGSASVLALAFVLPWRPAQVLSLSAFGLICVRGMWLLRQRHRS